MREHNDDIMVVITELKNPSSHLYVACQNHSSTPSPRSWSYTTTNQDAKPAQKQGNTGSKGYKYTPFSVNLT